MAAPNPMARSPRFRLRLALTNPTAQTEIRQHANHT